MQLEELNNRVDKLEKRDIQDLLTLLEIMSNATFFGGMKKTSCEHAKEGQCSLFYLKKGSTNKIPLATDCRINGCSDSTEHCHLETSAVACTFCPQWHTAQHTTKPHNQESSRRKNKRQEKLT